MNYLVTVYEDDKRLERVIFEYRESAVFFAERRRKQGYRVHIDPIKIV